MLLNVSEPSATIWSRVGVTGCLAPLEAGARIKLTKVKPDSTIMIATVTTGGDGVFTHVFTVDEAGS